MGRRLQDSEEVGTSPVEQTSKIGLEINEKIFFIIVSRKASRQK
jgi:hypothetical protein